MMAACAMLSCAARCPVPQTLSQQQQREFLTQVKQGMGSNLNGGHMTAGDIETVSFSVAVTAGYIVTSALLAARTGETQVAIVAAPTAGNKYDSCLEQC